MHLLTSGAEKFIERLGGGKTWSEVKFQGTINELTSLDFLESTGNDTNEMHTLVQEWIRDLDKDHVAEIQKRLCELLCCSLPDEENAKAFLGDEELTSRIL